MTDAPLSIEILPGHTGFMYHEGERFGPAVVNPKAVLIQAQLAAAARVPDLEAERDKALSAQRNLSDALDAAQRAITDLRARLDAAPDLTDLREAWGLSDLPATMRAIRRLLAAVPSTGTDGGGDL